MWKKVLYFGVAIVFGILIYIIGYSSNQMNHLQGIVNDAIEKEEFYKVPMVWDGCFDTNSIIENNGEKLDIVMYPSTSQTDVQYGSEDNTSRFLRYEKAYYIYMFNTKFSVTDVDTGSSKQNKTSVTFSNENNSYEYYFVVNDTINSQSYVEKPVTKEQALLNVSRNVTDTNSTWNFMRMTFTETMLNQIKKEIQGDITKLEIKDADGAVQYSTNIKLDFSQSFFSDMKDLFDNYNIYLDSYMAADEGKDSDKVKEADAKFQEFYTPWLEGFNANKEKTGYTFRYENSYLTPGKLVWQTIGMIALYALVIILFYILLFHFSAIKRLFSRDSYKPNRSGIMVNGKLVKRNAGKPTSNKPQVEVKPDTVADESLETVTAATVAVATNENVAVEEQPAENGSTEEVVEQPVENNSTEEVVEQPVENNPKEESKELDPVEEVSEEKTVEDEQPKEEAKVETPAVQEEKPEKKTAPKKKTTSSAKKPASKSSSTRKTSSSTKKTSNKGE